MADADIEPMIAQIRKRLSELVEGTDQEESFLLHLRSLGHFEQWKRDVYPETAVEFPPTIDIAYAVCHPDCRTEEFIVEGSTQECQRCGRLLYRTETREYVLK